MRASCTQRTSLLLHTCHPTSPLPPVPPPRRQRTEVVEPLVLGGVAGHDDLPEGAVTTQLAVAEPVAEQGAVSLGGPRPLHVQRHSLLLLDHSAGRRGDSQRSACMQAVSNMPNNMNKHSCKINKQVISTAVQPLADPERRFQGANVL